MIAIEKNTVELASFEANEHGRLLSGNRRFCRMFGFQESEIKWHYVTDLCRKSEDWESFRDSDVQESFNMRMKNRKGRSFCCKLYRSIKQDEEGRLVFCTTIRRVGDPEASVRASMTQGLALVFLARCAHCGGQVRVSTAGEARSRVMCDQCAASLYPEAYSISSAQV